ncbi:13621_t:CDS:2, partial [Rhizophagus irregularis]
NYIRRNYMRNTQQWALWARQHSPLLLQVTSTNPLESYHSELKRKTSSLHGLIGAVHNIVAIDCKKQSDSKSAAFDFRVKKVSAYGVEKDIIEEIHKFPLPFQHLLIKEACAVMDRLEKGKGTPGLTSLDCHYVKLLTTDVWRMFQKIFEESGFEVYEHRELVIEFVQTEQQKKAKSWKLTVFELTERVRDRYWSVEEGGNAERTEAFISTLEASLNPIIIQFK